VIDHGALDTDVTQVADALGVELPRTAGREHIADVKRLENESGGQFDHDFVSTMIAGHKKVIADTEAEVREGSSPKVTELARAALPTLRKHLNMLQKAAPTS
jgi:putative membrane protein